MLVQILAPKALIPLYVNLLPVECLLCVWDRVFSEDGGVWPTYALVAILVANADVMEAAVMDEMGDAYEALLDHTRNHLNARKFVAALDEVGAANDVKDVNNMRHSHKVSKMGGKTAPTKLAQKCDICCTYVTHRCCITALAGVTPSVISP